MGKSAIRSVRVRRLTLGVAAALATTAFVPSGASASPGDLDPGFGGAAHGRALFELGTVTAVAVQPHGGIIAVGFKLTNPRNAQATRLYPGGTRDPDAAAVTLPPSPTGATADAVARAAVAQPDGKVVVVGNVVDDSGNNDIAVWRLKASGVLDRSFDGDGLSQVGTDTSDDVAYAVAVDPQGRIVVAGQTSIAANADIFLDRLTAGGAQDTSFNRGTPLVLAHPGVDVARAVAIDNDDKIVMAGIYAGTPGSAVLRIDPGSETSPASSDAGFGGQSGIGGVANVPGTFAEQTTPTDVAVTSDDDLLVLDRVPTPDGFDSTVVRLSPGGSVDDTFGSATGAPIHLPGASTIAEALTLGPKGGITIVGTTTFLQSFLARFHPSGRPDTAVGPAGVKAVHAPEDLVDVATTADGRVVAAGNRTSGPNVVYRFLGDLEPPSCGGKKATIVGTQAPDTLVGTKHPDVISGLGGGDHVTGLGKGDIICGGAGKDHLSGGAGADHLYGGSGLDVLRGGPGRDLIKQ